MAKDLINQTTNHRRNDRPDQVGEENAGPLGDRKQRFPRSPDCPKFRTIISDRRPSASLVQRRDRNQSPTPPNPDGRPRSDPLQIFTVPEAADVLGISKSLAYELIARGDLPAVRLGRRIIVPARAIEAVLTQALQR